MSKMKLQEIERVSSYQNRLEYWTSKEMQLNVLHEEIINKREALLRTSGNFLHKTAQERPLINNTDATFRNNKLLKDVQSLEEHLMDQQHGPMNPRFAILQANYKSMVKNMFPVWQKSLQEMQTSTGDSQREKNN